MLGLHRYNTFFFFSEHSKLPRSFTVLSDELWNWTQQQQQQLLSIAPLRWCQRAHTLFADFFNAINIFFFFFYKKSPHTGFISTIIPFPDVPRVRGGGAAQEWSLCTADAGGESQHTMWGQYLAATPPSAPTTGLPHPPHQCALFQPEMVRVEQWKTDPECTALGGSVVERVKENYKEFSAL